MTLFSISPAQIVLTEIMFDPAENDNYYEFVEIWNSTDSAIDLAEWRLGDGDDDDAIIGFDSILILQPRQFGLILDPDYFDNPPIYQELIPDECLLLTVESATIGSYGLKNTEAETVTVYDRDYNIIAAYAYSIGNIQGYSEEKIDLLGVDDSTNWTDSYDFNGTPGFENSVSPDSFNLALISLSSSPENLQSGMTAVLTAVIANMGVEESAAFEVGFYIDGNEDSVLTENEMFTLENAPGLIPNQEIEVSAQTGSLQEGIYLFAASILNSDENLEDNFMFMSLAVGSPAGCIIFNEVMYKPASGEGEWVELNNRSDSAVYLEGWTFSDADTAGRIAIEPVELFPGEFLILAEDSTIFDWEIPAEAQVIILPIWNPLNNDGDTLYLFDAAGKEMEYIAYPNDWGDIDSGISMERINPFSSSELSQWFRCVAPAGGSPGSENSVFYAPAMNPGVTLTVSPEVFSPDGDEVDDSAVISYSLPVPYAHINIRIFDVRGRLVKHLINGQLTGSSGDVIWNGLSDEGDKCRIGPYIVHLEAISEAYKASYEAKAVVVLGGKL